ncbi:MAG: putative PEP-binding protein, partial [Spirochaetia bacterium]
ELPSAVESIEALARHADFLSVGTNDLVMYILGVDRTNDRVGSMYKDYHPSVLRSLERVVRVANEHGKPVSMCGDAASNVSMLEFLLGIGFTIFSVEPGRLPQMKSAVERASVQDSRKVARSLLGFETVKEVESFLYGSQE